MSEKERLYKKLCELREQVKNNSSAMEYYNYLKELNKNDELYGWEFQDDAILKDTLEDLDMYQDSYTRDVLRTYIGELEIILLRITII